MDAIILDFGSDIKGDSLLVGYENKIEIMSYSHNVAMQVTNDVSNSERTSGKPHVGEFTLTKFIDTSTPTSTNTAAPASRSPRRPSPSAATPPRATGRSCPSSSTP